MYACIFRYTHMQQLLINFVAISNAPRLKIYILKSLAFAYAWHFV